MNDIGLFILTNHLGKGTKEICKMSALCIARPSYLQVNGILRRFNSQMKLQPIHNLDFMRLHLSVALMLIPCACKPD